MIALEKLLTAFCMAGALMASAALATKAAAVPLDSPEPPAPSGSGAVGGEASAAPSAGAQIDRPAAEPGSVATETPPVAAAPPAPPAPTLIARIDLGKQQMTVQENGHLIRTWRVSSGRDGYPTPRGTFRAEWTAKMWYSRQYDMAPMPHAVFFKNGSAVHGTMETGRLGSPASHGCVRLSQANAAEFYKMVSRHGLAKTRIVVHGNPPVDRIARRDRRDRSEYASYRGRGYDQYGSAWSPFMGWSGPAPRTSPYGYGRY